MNWTPSGLNFWYAFSKSGISATHGGQDGNQKLSTTGCPANWDRLMVSPAECSSFSNSTSSKSAAVSDSGVGVGAGVLDAVVSPVFGAVGVGV